MTTQFPPTLKMSNVDELFFVVASVNLVGERIYVERSA
jgi:hypothetical protein